MTALDLRMTDSVGHAVELDLVLGNHGLSMFPTEDLGVVVRSIGF